MSIGLIFTKIKSATIFETIVALLVVMISFSAGMIIYQNVFSRSKGALEMSADFTGNHLADSLKNIGDYTNRKFKMNEFEVDLVYRPHAKYPGIYILELVIYDLNGRQLWATERLIP